MGDQLGWTIHHVVALSCLTGPSAGYVAPFAPISVTTEMAPTPSRDGSTPSGVPACPVVLEATGGTRDRLSMAAP
jgi:hypothetical protein